MKILKKTLIIVGSIIGVFLLIVALIGGKYYMDQKELQAEMLKVVKSKEAKEVFEEGLKNLDPKAFTKEGIIQSYEIDYDSIKHSPMGSIMVNIIVNGDQKLVAKYDLNRRTGKLKTSGVDLSYELSKLRKELSNEEFNR